MILLTFMGKKIQGKTLEECKARMFDLLVNPDGVTIEFDEYVVQPGESMCSIAEKLYGDRGRWREIAKHNRKDYLRADMIYPGAVLKLPKFAKM